MKTSENLLKVLLGAKHEAQILMKDCLVSLLDPWKFTARFVVSSRVAENRVARQRRCYEESAASTKKELPQFFFGNLRFLDIR